MDIVILDSAYKHGISKESILSCLLNFRNDIVIDGNISKRLFVGFDDKGNELEIIGVEDNENDRLVVFHAMKLRRQFYGLLSGEGEI